MDAAAAIDQARGALAYGELAVAMLARHTVFSMEKFLAA